MKINVFLNSLIAGNTLLLQISNLSCTKISQISQTR